MRPQWKAWLLGGCMALTVAALAGEAGAGDETSECTIKKDDVKTWLMTTNGREYAVHPATPTYEGTTACRRCPRAATSSSPPACGGWPRSS